MTAPAVPPAPPPAAADVKPGIRTTEFWVTLLLAAAPVVSLVFHRDITSQVQSLAVIAAGIATAAYAISRAITKSSATAAATAPSAAPPPTPAASGTPTTADSISTILAVLEGLQQIIAETNRLQGAASRPAAAPGTPGAAPVPAPGAAPVPAPGAVADVSVPAVQAGGTPPPLPGRAV